MFWFALLASVLVVVELILFAGLSLRDGRPRTWSDWQRERAEVVARFGEEHRFDYPEIRRFGAEREDVLHPYVGYVGDPTARETIHELGFRTTENPIQRRAEDRLIVAVLGGSVADGFAKLAPTLLARELDHFAEIDGREIVVVNLAGGGYKQPQQLMVLNYLLALGGQFDVVINIDGFNDVALHEFENATRGVHPAFPRVWIVFVNPVPDPFLMQSLGEREYLEANMVSLAQAYSLSPFRYSMLGNALWDLRRQRILARYVATVERVTRYQKQADEIVERQRPAPYRITGPRLDFATRDEMYSYLASLWINSSIQLDRLCRANGALYLHFLQPNQYVTGSKPMTPQERRVAFNPEQLYKPGVETGYPQLVAAGDGLVEAGVRFADLTQIFADVEQQLYVDDCCHFGLEGYEIMTGHVASAFRESWAGRPDARPRI